MACEDNVLFMRGIENKTLDDDAWDDSALIKAYDKAINLAKEEVSKRMAMETQNVQPKQKAQSVKHSRQSNKIYNKKWTVGAPCRAVYSEDGELYEAIINKIYENTGICIVKFVGYGNTEKVELSSLMESEGLQSQIAQQKDALAEKCNNDTSESSYSSNSKKANGAVDENMECENQDPKPFKSFRDGTSFDSTMEAIPPAPPLPPQLMATLPENDADALSSMLMSWYISGFHTGYYHGLRHAKNSQEKRKNC